MVKFRAGVLRLRNNVCRWQNIEVCERNCPVCKTDLEDEYHFLLKCPAYKDLRDRFLPKNLEVNMKSFRNILKQNKTENINCLARFIYMYYADKIRERLEKQK